MDNIYNNKLKDIDTHINTLTQEKNELDSEILFLDEAKQNLGRCFFDSEQKVYFKILDIPKMHEQEYHVLVSRPNIERLSQDSSQDNIIPFYTMYINLETLTSYEEITNEYFSDVCAGRFAKFQQLFDLVKL